MLKQTIILLLFLGLGACTKKSPMNSIRQTVDSLIIDTPQVRVTVPGVWLSEEKRPAENVVYRGHSDEGEIHKRFIVAGHLLTPGQTEVGRKEAFQDLLRMRRETEDEITAGKAKIIEEPLRESGELLGGGYIAIHLTAGRIVFSRAMCDHEKAFNFYYELWGFSAKPDVKKLMEDFETIMETAGLK
ncbi:MAG: hypothetical protein JWL59_4468 [Chthoniobacteraceae bacterium]|nr:hypothetical protein [Chthoniobacteraceae bacterium]